MYEIHGPPSGSLQSGGWSLCILAQGWLERARLVCRKVVVFKQYIGESPINSKPLKAVFHGPACTLPQSLPYLSTTVTINVSQFFKQGMCSSLRVFTYFVPSFWNTQAQPNTIPPSPGLSGSHTLDLNLNTVLPFCFVSSKKPFLTSRLVWEDPMLL